MSTSDTESHAERTASASTLARPLQFKGPRYGASSGTIIKIVLLGVVNALVIAGLPTMLSKPDYPIAIASIIALVVIDVVYLSKRSVPLKYLIPGSCVPAVFALLPDRLPRLHLDDQLRHGQQPHQESGDREDRG